MIFLILNILDIINPFISGAIIVQDSKNYTGRQNFRRNQTPGLYYTFFNGIRIRP